MLYTATFKEILFQQVQAVIKVWHMSKLAIFPGSPTTLAALFILK